MQKIGEILVTKGYVTQQQLDGVLAVKGEDAQVGQVLIQWGLLTEQQLMEALRELMAEGKVRSYLKEGGDVGNPDHWLYEAVQDNG